MSTTWFWRCWRFRTLDKRFTSCRKSSTGSRTMKGYKVRHKHRQGRLKWDPPWFGIIKMIFRWLFSVAVLFSQISSSVLWVIQHWCYLMFSKGQSNKMDQIPQHPKSRNDKTTSSSWSTMWKQCLRWVWKENGCQYSEVGFSELLPSWQQFYSSLLPNSTYKSSVDTWLSKLRVLVFYETRWKKAETCDQIIKTIKLLIVTDVKNLHWSSPLQHLPKQKLNRIFAYLSNVQAKWKQYWLCNKQS